MYNKYLKYKYKYKYIKYGGSSYVSLKDDLFAYLDSIVIRRVLRYEIKIKELNDKILVLIDILNHIDEDDDYEKLINILISFNFYDLIFQINEDYISRHINDKIGNQKSITFLIAAVLSNNIGNVEKCIEYGSNLSKTDKYGLNALDWSHFINLEIESYLKDIIIRTRTIPLIRTRTIPLIRTPSELKTNITFGSIVEIENINLHKKIIQFKKELSLILDSNKSIINSGTINDDNKYRFFNNNALIVVNINGNKANLALLSSLDFGIICDILNETNIEIINEKVKREMSELLETFLLSLPVIIEISLDDLKLFKPMKIIPFSISSLNNYVYDYRQHTQYFISAHGNNNDIMSDSYIKLQPNITILMRCEPYKNLLIYGDDIKNFYNNSDNVETFLPEMLGSKNFCIFKNKCPNLLLEFQDDSKFSSSVSLLDFGIFKIPIQYNVSSETINIRVNEVIDKLTNNTIIKKDIDDFLVDIQKQNQSSYLKRFIGNKITLDRVIDAITYEEIDIPNRNIDKEIKILEKELDKTESIINNIKYLRIQKDALNRKKIIIVVHSCRT